MPKNPENKAMRIYTTQHTHEVCSPRLDMLYCFVELFLVSFRWARHLQVTQQLISKMAV